VTRVDNAADFLIAFRAIRDRYEDYFAPQLARLRQQMAAAATKPLADLIADNLEAHARLYFVNSVLAILNWRHDVDVHVGIANIFVEAPVASVSEETTRFLDYLGVETRPDASLPLLLVETKRPNSPLPGLRDAKRIPSTLSEVFSRGLNGERLTGDWSTWLVDVRDYVNSIRQRTGETPKRVIIMNGDWAVVFLDPAQAFLGKPDPRQIEVYANSTEIEARYAAFFDQLNYARLVRSSPPVQLPALALRIPPQSAARLMRGLHLLYSERPKLYFESAPELVVAPLFFVRLTSGAWIRVEIKGQEFPLPHRHSDLGEHLTEVAAASDAALATIRQTLGDLPIVSIAEHYADPQSFAALHGVEEIRPNIFIVVTGTESHYVRAEPTIQGCPFHDWQHAQLAGLAVEPMPTGTRSVGPRAFFLSTEDQYCSHEHVRAPKCTPITTENRDRVGPRSGAEGDPFCEIWKFETRLCCRTCVFEPACTSTVAFALPCAPA
jgi:hypothetical protein